MWRQVKYSGCGKLWLLECDKRFGTSYILSLVAVCLCMYVCVCACVWLFVVVWQICVFCVCMCLCLCVYNTCNFSVLASRGVPLISKRWLSLHRARNVQGLQYFFDTSKTHLYPSLPSDACNSGRLRSVAHVCANDIIVVLGAPLAFTVGLEMTLSTLQRQDSETVSSTGTTTP